MADFNSILRKKIVSIDELERHLYTFKFFGKKVVFTNGCFDIIHPGHIYYLNKARSLGDVLIVGLNSDTSVKSLNKGEERPIHPQDNRSEVLASLICVDYICIFDEETPFELIKKVKPDILVKGGDYTIDKIVGADFVQSYGGKVEIISYLEGYSTTNILNKLRKNL
jgi:D-beta-D-heptose 7-phosphate kinase/D-beta-D-heptose 1-phosphate adenosyltransferase